MQGSRTNKLTGNTNIQQPASSSPNLESSTTASLKPNPLASRIDNAEEDDASEPRTDAIEESSPLTSTKDDEKGGPSVRTAAAEAPSISTSFQSKDKGKGKASGPTLEVPVGRKEIARKGRELPEGLGSLDTRALFAKARIGSLRNEELDVRLDSGADITLISEDYWRKLGNLPKPKVGLWMKLYQLTGEAKILGYVKFPTFMMSTDKVWIQFDTEAYVVKNMNIEILLGEDFLTTYELSTLRNASGSHVLSVGQSSCSILAFSTKSSLLNFEIRSAAKTQSFVRVKNVVIAPGTVHRIKVTGPFEGREDWLVEKLIIGTEDASILAAPTTWISSSQPEIPIANTSIRPWIIRAGDVVGHLLNPLSLDNPRSEED
ncbi:hypothetical protein K435DRAFT_666648, partial [Dendrothele bispora CBS 962.96]